MRRAQREDVRKEPPRSASSTDRKGLRGRKVPDMIKKQAKGYVVLSHNGKKKLGGPYKTKKDAEKRLRQVEFFKHHKGA